MAEQFYIGETAVVALRAYSVDPVSGDKTPEPAASAVVIRFKNPDGTVLAQHNLASGVTNAGEGWYWASATPEVEGLHEIEMEVGTGINQGRDRITFGVSPF
jgi:hypothetical protein